MIKDFKNETALRVCDIHIMPPFDKAGRNGGPISQTTPRYWITKGIRGVKLDCVRIGISPFTTVEALQRFMVAVDGSIGAAAALDT